jgi:hypothetical protein
MQQGGGSCQVGMCGKVVVAVKLGHVTVYRDSISTHIHLAVLSACLAHAQYAVVWSALARPRPHYYLWCVHTLFVLYALCCHATHVLYMWCCDLCMHWPTRDNIELCHERPSTV